jgi:hypothetical protein
MTLLLQDGTLSAVRRLLAAEPEVASLMPDTALRAMQQAVGCDAAASLRPIRRVMFSGT